MTFQSPRLSLQAPKLPPPGADGHVNVSVHCCSTRTKTRWWLALHPSQRLNLRVERSAGQRPANRCLAKSTTQTKAGYACQCTAFASFADVVRRAQLQAPPQPHSALPVPSDADLAVLRCAQYALSFTIQLMMVYQDCAGSPVGTGCTCASGRGGRGRGLYGATAAAAASACCCRANTDNWPAKP